MVNETLVAVAGPFDWDRTVARARQQNTHDVCLTRDGAARWESVVATEPGSPVGVAVVGLAGAIGVRSTACDPAQHDAAVSAVASRFSVAADADGFYGRLRDDPWLGPLAARWWGLRPLRDASPWVALARLILGQQVSAASHRTVVNRLLRRWGHPTVTPSGGAVAAWPDPADLSAETMESLVAGGIPHRPAATLQRAARWAEDGGLVGEPHEVAKRLLTLQGVGPWTAAGVALFGWGDDDAVMESDLVLRRAAAALAQVGRPFTPRALAGRLEPYRPYRGWVCYLLWQEHRACR